MSRRGMRVRFTRIPGETPKGILGRPLILPAKLGGFGFSEEASHTEYDTVSRGQFSQPAMGNPEARSLRVVDDLETLVVAFDARWNLDPARAQRDVHRALFEVLRSKRPVQMVVTSRYAPINPLIRADVTFRNVSPEVREGEPDTVYYSIGVTEWRDSKVRRKGTETGGKSDHTWAERTKSKWAIVVDDDHKRKGGREKLPVTITLDARDTLASLAGEYMPRTPVKVGARAIARANSLSGPFGNNTYLTKHGRLKIGSKIKIPKAPD